MIKAEENNLHIDGAAIPFKKIHMVKPFGEDCYIVNILTGKCVQFPYKLEEVYTALKAAGKTEFMLINNIILNCGVVDMQYIQTAKSKKDELGYALHIVFNNGRTEQIFFKTHNEAEAFYHEIDNKLIDIKTAKCLENLK